MTKSLSKLLLCASVSIFALSGAKAATYFTIDVPGAIDTLPNAISESGTVVGSYCAGHCHGFVRSPDGTITTFDAGGLGTNANAINDDGTVTGSYGDLGERDAGYVRTADGTIKTFSGNNAKRTVGTGINDQGVATGYIEDDTFTLMHHGFIRSRNGTLQLFDVNGADGGTNAAAINKAGVVTGSYTSGGVTHGYTRSADGSITSFDPQGSLGTTPMAVNRNGDIAGYYRLNTQGLTAAFVRTSDGNISTFSAPGDSGGTGAVAINNHGVVAGSVAVQQTLKGFLRNSSGNIKEFDDPDAVVPGGTVPIGINREKVIVGYFYGSDKHYHGFLRMPGH
jgi:hypothetical protein